MRFAVLTFRRNPRFDVVLLDLPETEVSAAVDDDMVRELQHLEKLFRICGQLFVVPHGLLVARFAQDHLLELEELMHAEDAFRIFAVAPSLPPETRRE